MKSNYGEPPVRGPAHERLEVFVGTWHAEGVSFGRNQDPGDPRANGEPWVSDEVTQWHPGQYFLIQRENARTGVEPLITHAVIGFEAREQSYFAYSFENHGFTRRYVLTAEAERVWRLTGELERARIEFSRDGREQSVLWEWRPFGEAWLPLCERQNVRVR